MSLSVIRHDFPCHIRGIWNTWLHWIVLWLYGREGFGPSNWKCNPVLIQVSRSIFQKQVSTTPCPLYLNSVFVQKKGEIGAFYKQGSGLAHSLVQENPEKDNSEVSCSLDCAKYPPLCKAKQSLWLPSPADLHVVWENPQEQRGVLCWCSDSQSLPASLNACQAQIRFLESPCFQWASQGRALSSSWGAWCWIKLQQVWTRASPCQVLSQKSCPQFLTPCRMKSLILLQRS